MHGRIAAWYLNQITRGNVSAAQRRAQGSVLAMQGRAEAVLHCSMGLETAPWQYKGGPRQCRTVAWHLRRRAGFPEEG